MMICVNGLELVFYQCTACGGGPCHVAVDEKYCNILSCSMNDGIKPNWVEGVPEKVEVSKEKPPQ